MEIKAVIHEAEEGGYWAEVPALPGCFTQGETLEELKANVLEAVQCWLEGALKDVVSFQMPRPRRRRRQPGAVLA